MVGRTHIYRLTVRLQETLLTAASYICHFLCPYHVTRKYFAFYRILEHYDAIVLCRNYCREKCIELGKGFGIVLTETISKYLNMKQLYESAEQLCLQLHFEKIQFFLQIQFQA